MSRPGRTKQSLIDAIRAKADRLGIQPGEIAPSASQLGAVVTNACVRAFGSLGAAQVNAGYRVNPRGGPRAGQRARKPKQVLRDDPKPAEKVVVFEAPQPAYALSPKELAAERAASLERRRKAREAEPRHQPLPYTGKERSRMWRVRSVEEEWEEDRRAMEAEVAA